MTAFNDATADTIASCGASITAMRDVEYTLHTAKLALNLSKDKAIAGATAANANAAVDATTAATQAVAAAQATANALTAVTDPVTTGDATQ